MNGVFVIALFLFWLVLSASLSPVHLIIGAIAAIAVVWLSPKDTNREKAFSLFSALAYGPWLFVRVMKSGIHVCKLILHPKLPVKPALIEHKTELSSDGELAVLGNSITLTPGTITIEVEPGRLIVHALDEDSLADINSGALEQKVGALFKHPIKRPVKQKSKERSL